MNAAERALAGLALSLIDDHSQLTKRERTLHRHIVEPNPEQLGEARASILAGGDPLGEVFSRVRSAEIRREAGAIYTPAPIVEAMVAWARAEATPPSRIVDPGAGSGRYLIAAAREFSAASLVAVETDPLATLMLRANASVLGFADRLSVMLRDYREIDLPEIEGPTLYIGNPPYVRHHDIPESWKNWFGDTARSLGFSASKLAGLHIHFFLKTRHMARPGDFGAFITAAEWIDVNYGSVLRKMLADGLGGHALHVLDAKTRPFADALATGAITCFRLGGRGDSLAVRHVDSLEGLSLETPADRVPWIDLERAPRWSTLIRKGAPRDPGHIELGELFRVSRGQVTGANPIWIAGPNASSLPSRFLRPTITRARELFAAGPILIDASALKRVVDLPADLNELTAAERKAVLKFLNWAKAQGVQDSFVAQHRRAWWSVGLYDPAPILATYMARRPPAFVRNQAQVRHLNIAHGLYPRQPMSSSLIDEICLYLNHNTQLDSGRSYAGGLVKFEPKEMERITIPRPTSL